MAFQVFVVSSGGRVSRGAIETGPTPELGDLVRLSLAGKRLRIIVERVSRAVLRASDHGIVDIVVGAPVETETLAGYAVEDRADLPG